MRLYLIWCIFAIITLFLTIQVQCHHQNISSSSSLLTNEIHFPTPPSAPPSSWWNNFVGFFQSTPKDDLISFPNVKNFSFDECKTRYFPQQVISFQESTILKQSLKMDLNKFKIYNSTTTMSPLLLFQRKFSVYGILASILFLVNLYYLIQFYTSKFDFRMSSIIVTYSIFVILSSSSEYIFQFISFDNDYLWIYYFKLYILSVNYQDLLKDFQLLIHFILFIFFVFKVFKTNYCSMNESYKKKSSSKISLQMIDPALKKKSTTNHQQQEEDVTHTHGEEEQEGEEEVGDCVDNE
jgi:hypothetical protein